MLFRSNWWYGYRKPTAGQPGSAVFEFDINGVLVKNNGVFDGVKNIYVKKDGDWHKVKNVYVKKSGVWVQPLGNLKNVTPFQNVYSDFGPSSRPYS